MAAIPLATAQAKLQSWLDAEDALATAQSTDVNGIRVTRADLAQVREQIAFWERRVERAARGGGPSVSRVVLRG